MLSAGSLLECWFFSFNLDLIEFEPPAIGKQPAHRFSHPKPRKRVSARLNSPSQEGAP
jgi:hypothetical protein